MIPKVAKTERITEFRPISLCNVIYKIGSKVIANRVKPFLDKIISPTQSAFVPHRLITDNVLIAIEMNHFLKCQTRTKRPYMALKLDISMAYDRIEWIFLKKVLIRIGFPIRLVDTIFQCISTVSYAFLLNGAQFGSVIPARGLRQGDPLAPYLFIYCVEVFIRMVEHSVTHGRLGGVRIFLSALVISNLCFPDDTLLFGRATMQEADEVLRILNTYARISGQIINLDKSSINFSPNTPEPIRAHISQSLGIHQVQKFEKYLGSPAELGRSKKAIFSYLKERLWSLVEGWSEKKLSMAGLEVLIKSVLQSIPTYVMSCFFLPRGILNDMEKIICQYWWGSGIGQPMSWMAWLKLSNKG